MIIKRGNQINDKIEHLLVTITVDGNECEFTHVAPVGLSDAELQKYAEAREASYKHDILRDMYPDRPKIKPTEKQTEVEAIDAWVKDGAKIPAVLDAEEKEIEPEKMAVKRPWTNKHPGETLQEQVNRLRLRIKRLEER